MEGCVRGLMQGTTLTFVSRNWGQPLKIRFPGRDLISRPPKYKPDMIWEKGEDKAKKKRNHSIIMGLSLLFFCSAVNFHVHGYACLALDGLFTRNTSGAQAKQFVVSKMQSVNCHCLLFILLSSLSSPLSFFSFPLATVLPFPGLQLRELHTESIYVFLLLGD